MMDAMTAAIVVQAQACMARVEGMKAENAYRAVCGDSPAYREQEFSNEASSLEYLSTCLRARAEW